MKKEGGTANNDVQFNLHVAGGWAGKKKFPESLQHFSQLKMHRSFDQGVTDNIDYNAR